MYARCVLSLMASKTDKEIWTSPSGAAPSKYAGFSLGLSSQSCGTDNITGMLTSGNSLRGSSCEPDVVDAVSAVVGLDRGCLSQPQKTRLSAATVASRKWRAGKWASVPSANGRTLTRWVLCFKAVDGSELRLRIRKPFIRRRV